MVRALAAIVVLVVVFGAGVAVGRFSLNGAETDSAADPDAPALQRGSQGDPIPVGQTAPVGPWEVLVRGFADDATSAVLAANQFNVEPPEGQVYVTVEVVLTRRGAGPDVIRGALQPSLVTPAGAEFPLGNECGVLATPVDSGRLVGQGENVVGEWCWRVPVVEVPKLTLRVAGTGGGAVWFELL